MRFLLALCLCAARAAAEPAWLSSLPEALSASAAQHKPVLIDFQAPWCYSCYYMEKNVLSREAFLKKAEGLVLLKVDVDTPEGRALEEKYRVRFLPSYVLADSKGEPLARIVGEHTEADFLDKLTGFAAGPADDAETRIVKSLRSLMLADDNKGARALVASLREPERRELSGNPDWKILISRLDLMSARGGHNNAGGLTALKTLLGLESSCELATDVAYGDDLLEKASPKERQSLRKLERGPLEALAKDKLFLDRCPDFRTGIEELADVYKDLGDAPKRQDLLRKAVDHLKDAQPKVGVNRNRDDNLRFFLELAEEDAEVRRLYPELIGAYASDYVYPYRFAKYLASKKDFAAALPQIEKADKLCYGANRLRVTNVRAMILAKLGRKDEALPLLKRDIKAGAKSFPKDTEELKALLKELAK